MGAPEFTSSLEPQIAEIGTRLHELASHAKPSLFNGRGLRGRLAARALADEGLRTALFTCSRCSPTRSILRRIG